MIADIKDLDGGWAAVSRKTGLSEAFLQKVLDLDSKSKNRLETFEKIKAGILECQQDDSKRMESLLA